MGTILVVDDSAMMRKIILRTLKMAGLDFAITLEAADGAEGLALLRENTVSLVMCDINMPVMSGLEMLEQIKAEQLAAGVPIVMVTTEGSEQQVSPGAHPGALAATSASRSRPSTSRPNVKTACSTAA